MLLSWMSLFFAISVLACIASAKPSKNNANPLEFSYIVSIQTQIPKAKSFLHSCAGSIISPKFVLTAAHCINDKPKDTKFRISAGSQQTLSGKNDNRQYINVAKKIIHPKFVAKTSTHDIALLELQTALKMTPYIKMVILPRAKSFQPSKSGTKIQTAVISGWGTISKRTDGEVYDVLQTAKVSFLSPKQCLRVVNSVARRKKNLKTKYKVFGLTDNLCTGPMTGSTASCNGDAGGPLVKDRVLVGITSWTGLPCGGANRPTIYTKVDQYIEFIEKNVKDLPSIA